MKRSLSEYNKLITSQNKLNIPPQAFFTTNAIVDSHTGPSLEYPQLKLGEKIKKWTKGKSNEIGRLTLDVHPQMMICSNIIYFIHPNQKSSDRVSVYLHIVS